MWAQSNVHFEDAITFPFAEPQRRDKKLKKIPRDRLTLSSVRRCETGRNSNNTSLHNTRIYATVDLAKPTSRVNNAPLTSYKANIVLNF